VRGRRAAEWVVDTFALSCRVLGWGVERALAAAVCRIATEAGAVGLEGQYLATAKNRQTEFFYRDLGFTPVAASEGGSRWRLALPAPTDLAPPWVRLRVEQYGE
jgi:predicted enzyme involved in methoxymalonyl-ACP biosynthesis